MNIPVEKFTRQRVVYGLGYNYHLADTIASQKMV